MQAKSVSRSLVINTGMFTEKNAFVICETLTKFQKKIVSLEINHNLLESNDKERMTACPNAVYLVSLLKALRQCKAIKIVCNPDFYALVHESIYKQLAFAITRSNISKSRREEHCNLEDTDYKQKISHL